MNEAIPLPDEKEPDGRNNSGSDKMQADRSRGNVRVRRNPAGSDETIKVR
jgi:hypothetical protein